MQLDSTQSDCFASTFRMLTAILAISSLAMVTPVSGASNEDLKFQATDGASGDQFGISVAMDNGVAAVGAPGADDNGTDSGTAYLFDIATGAEQVKLTATDGAAGDEFGSAVALSDGIVAVGAPGKADNGTGSGAAYLFDAATGAQITKLLPVDGAEGDAFGTSVAIDAGIVAVGAMFEDGFAEDGGAVYLFDATTGTQLDKLQPDQDGNRNFGVSIAMDDDIVAVGARMHFDLEEGFTLGAVYLFEASTGTQRHRLESSNNTWTDFFGDTVDIDDGIVAVGAWAKSIFFDHSGAAYLFDAVSGSQLAYIVPDDGHDRDHFGTSISISNGTVAIGADEDDDSAWSAGSAYLYDTTGAFIEKLLISDGAAFDRFGSSIATSGGTVVCGAIGSGGSGTQTGYVGVFGNNVAADVSDGPSATFRGHVATPNPFRSHTTLSYVLEAPARVGLEILSVDGGRVRSLVDGQQREAGTHYIDWDGRDAQGREVAAGVFYVRLFRNAEVSWGRVVRLR